MSSTWVLRKDFEETFLELNNKGKSIWVINKVNRLPIEIYEIALRLADLDFIKYIRICDETIAASSDNYPKRPKIPITKLEHETAIGVQLLYSSTHKYIIFFEINSPIKGNGSKMVDAILKGLPNDWQPALIMDWSGGFWDKMKDKYSELNWMC